MQHRGIGACIRKESHLKLCIIASIRITESRKRCMFYESIKPQISSRLVTDLRVHDYLLMFPLRRIRE
jgi:hypothetical protein